MLALHQAQQRASRVAAQAKRNKQRMHTYQLAASGSEVPALPIAGGGVASSSGQVVEWDTLERDLSRILDQDEFESVPLPFLGAPLQSHTVVTHGSTFCKCTIECCGCWQCSGGDSSRHGCGWTCHGGRSSRHTCYGDNASRHPCFGGNTSRHDHATCLVSRSPSSPV